MRVSQVTISTCQFIWLASSVLVSSGSACPEPYMEDSRGFCLYQALNAFDYCAAHDQCYLWGEIVGGRGFIAGKYYKNLTGLQFPNYWTGLHRLSSDVGVESNSWSVADPHSIGEVIREIEMLPINNDLPEEDKRIMVASYDRFQTSLIKNVGSFVGNPILCQVSGFGEKRIDPAAVELFKRDPSHETHFSSDRIQGCMDDATAPTKMACAMRCKLNRACRSFAYHPDTKECIIHKYIPSKLNSDVEPKDGKWERFIRPGW